MLIVMDKSTHEEHLSRPSKTYNKQIEIAVTFLSGYNGIFNVTNTNYKFCFKKTITDEDGFIQITIPQGAELNSPFTIKPNFSTLGSFIKISSQGPIISFMFDDSIRTFLRFNA